MSVSGLNPQEYDLTELRRAWYVLFVKITNVTRNSLKRSFFPGDFEVAKNPQKLDDFVSAGIFPEDPLHTN